MQPGIRHLVLLVFALALLDRPAGACGAFVPADRVKTPPRLDLERTLVIWDSATRMQHFVREVRFTQDTSPFSFVVPTPGRPSVYLVERSPFDELEQRYPASLFSDVGLLGLGVEQGPGGGFGSGLRAARPAPVSVVERKRVGDFTAFVLTATDRGALAAWLEKNGFESSEAGKAWTDVYVRLGFHFVALRYEGARKVDESLTSRTVRIRFESELPYYPYREPADAPARRTASLRSG